MAPKTKKKKAKSPTRPKSALLKRATKARKSIGPSKIAAAALDHFELHKSVRDRMPLIPFLFPVLFIAGIFIFNLFVARTDRGGRAEFSFNDGLEITERMEHWSELLKKSPQMLSRYNSAKVNDVVSLIPERFDCTTYVETVAALAQSNSPNDFYDNLLSLRYRNGAASFETRNHFPEADWLPNNVDAGNIQDITATVARAAGIRSATVAKTIHKRSWFAKNMPQQSGRGIASLRLESVPETVEARVDYIPLDRFEEAVKHIPSGAILNVVHADRPQKPVLISHQGILIRKGSQTLFRHAGRTHEIMDSTLSKYVAQCRQRTWKVLGFNVNQVVLR